MARKKVERNISYDEERRKYYVNFDFGLNPETGRQVKKTKTFDKLTTARSALRKHEAARDVGQVVLPKEITVSEWLRDCQCRFKIVRKRRRNFVVFRQGE